MFNPFARESYRSSQIPPEGKPKPETDPNSVDHQLSATPTEPTLANQPSIEVVPPSPQVVETISIPHEVVVEPEPNDLHSEAAKLVQEKTGQQVQDNPGAG